MQARVKSGWGVVAALAGESKEKTWALPNAVQRKYWVALVFVVGLMAAGTGIAGEVLPCPVDTASIRIMTPDYGGIESSVTGINDALPHFRTFVTAVTERVATHLTKEKLCITGAKDMERGHSLLQFVYWPLDIHNEYIVPVLPVTGGFPGCKISSPWIDLIFVRTPVPFIQGIVRWNERQLLADQAALSGARNVPTGVAMPLSSYELGQFIGTYADTERSDPRAVKSLEERVPPDILWLLRRSPQTSVGRTSMRIARKEGAEGYTKLVLLLLDRCFAASNEKILHYNSIIDIDDPVLLEQYRIDMELY